MAPCGLGPNGHIQAALPTGMPFPHPHPEKLGWRMSGLLGARSGSTALMQHTLHWRTHALQQAGHSARTILTSGEELKSGTI